MIKCKCFLVSFSYKPPYCKNHKFDFKVINFKNVSVNNERGRLPSRTVVAAECKEVFESVKMLKTLRYIIYSINVKSTGDRNADFDHFLNDLKKGGKSECGSGGQISWDRNSTFSDQICSLIFDSFDQEVDTSIMRSKFPNNAF